MQKWEYAELSWHTYKGGKRVIFTHREEWRLPDKEAGGYFPTLRRLGEEGWEMIGELPESMGTSVGFLFKRPLS